EIAAGHFFDPTRVWTLATYWDHLSHGERSPRHQRVHARLRRALARRVRGYGPTRARTPSPQPSPHGRGSSLPALQDCWSFSYAASTSWMLPRALNSAVVSSCWIVASAQMCPNGSMMVATR